MCLENLYGAVFKYDFQVTYLWQQCCYGLVSVTNVGMASMDPSLTMSYDAASVK